jgi:hypothetical protein
VKSDVHNVCDKKRNPMAEIEDCGMQLPKTQTTENRIPLGSMHNLSIRFGPQFSNNNNDRQTKVDFFLHNLKSNLLLLDDDQCENACQKLLDFCESIKSREQIEFKAIDQCMVDKRKADADPDQAVGQATKKLCNSVIKNEED